MIFLQPKMYVPVSASLTQYLARALSVTNTGASWWRCKSVSTSGDRGPKIDPLRCL